MSWGFLVKMNLKALRTMDRFTVRKYKDIYRVFDADGIELFEGSISDCYGFIRLFVMNLIEE